MIPWEFAQACGSPFMNCLSAVEMPATMVVACSAICKLNSGPRIELRKRTVGSHMAVKFTAGPIEVSDNVRVAQLSGGNLLAVTAGRRDRCGPAKTSGNFAGRGLVGRGAVGGRRQQITAVFGVNRNAETSRTSHLAHPRT